MVVVAVSIELGWWGVVVEEIDVVVVRGTIITSIEIAVPVAVADAETVERFLAHGVQRFSTAIKSATSIVVERWQIRNHFTGIGCPE